MCCLRYTPAARANDHRQGYRASFLLKALQQGPVEERLAYLEAILVKSSSGSDIFNFTQKRETPGEQLSETTKED